MIVRSAGLVLLILATGACATASNEPAGRPPDEPPYIEGTITSVSQTGQGTVVMVEEPGGNGNKAAVTIGPDTVVVQEFGGGYEPAGLDLLGQGRRVAVWTTGPVMESFPVQLTASTIVIRE